MRDPQSSILDSSSNSVATLRGSYRYQLRPGAQTRWLLACAAFSGKFPHKLAKDDAFLFATVHGRRHKRLPHPTRLLDPHSRTSSSSNPQMRDHSEFGKTTSHRQWGYRRPIVSSDANKLTLCALCGQHSTSAWQYIALETDAITVSDSSASRTDTGVHWDFSSRSSARRIQLTSHLRGI